MRKPSGGVPTATCAWPKFHTTHAAPSTLHSLRFHLFLRTGRTPRTKQISRLLHSSQEQVATAKIIWDEIDQGGQVTKQDFEGIQSDVNKLSLAVNLSLERLWAHAPSDEKPPLDKLHNYLRYSREGNHFELLDDPEYLTSQAVCLESKVNVPLFPNTICPHMFQNLLGKNLTQQIISKCPEKEDLLEAIKMFVHKSYMLDPNRAMKMIKKAKP